MTLQLSLLTTSKANEKFKYYQKKVWFNKSESFFYRTAKPQTMDEGKSYPLLVFFHGAGGRGEDNKKQLLDAGGLESFEKNKLRTKHQSHIFAGQVPHGKKWVNVSWSILDIKCRRFQIRCKWRSRL